MLVADLRVPPPRSQLEPKLSVGRKLSGRAGRAIRAQPASWVLSFGVRPRPLLAAATVILGLATARHASADVNVVGGHTRIPFDLRGGHVWVRGTIGDSDSLWIAIDTGASSSAIDENEARALGLATHGRYSTLGAGGADSSSSVSNLTFVFGGVSIHRDQTDTNDLAQISVQGGHPMQAIIGAELFESCVVRLDYGKGMMEIWDAAHAASSLPGAVVPLALEGHHPYVEGVLAVAGTQPLRGRFVIDTGSNAGIILAPDAAARAGLPQAFPRTLQTVGFGVGGEVHNHLGRAESFTLGSLRFDHPIAFVPDSLAGRISAPGSAGNIGSGVLGRCAITFDYRHLRVAFEPGTDFRRPFDTDMLGATPIRRSDGYEVRFVNADTPAADAGLHVGDLIVAINGTPCTTIDPTMLRRLLQQPGQSVRLDVRRGGVTRTITTTLRRLI